MNSESAEDEKEGDDQTNSLIVKLAATVIRKSTIDVDPRMKGFLL